VLYDKDDRVPRVEWLREFGVNDRQEKRARALRLPWPPHVTLGRRVFYTRQRTLEWFTAQEAESLLGVRPRDRWERGHPTKDGPSPPEHQHRQRRW
jgi:hypothetical protein